MRIEDVHIILNLLIRYKLTKSMLAPGFYQKQKKSEPQTVAQVAEVSEANMYLRGHLLNIIRTLLPLAWLLLICRRLRVHPKFMRY